MHRLHLWIRYLLCSVRCWVVRGQTNGSGVDVGWEWQQCVMGKDGKKNWRFSLRHRCAREIGYGNPFHTHAQWVGFFRYRCCVCHHLQTSFSAWSQYSASIAVEKSKSTIVGGWEWRAYGRVGGYANGDFFLFIIIIFRLLYGLVSYSHPNGGAAAAAATEQSCPTRE